ncbi:PglL family O-oligosaccharyltransferase [Aromatoleum toluvorans]|nr:O-antigen ligase family protein [Aromatoleum toluvorans]
MAILICLLLPFAVVMCPRRFTLDHFSLLIALAATIPAVQYALGKIPNFGHAWINSLYVIGFLSAVLVGRFWEASRPRELIDMLCLAFGAASLLSVLLQAYQWFELDGLGIWLADSDSARPSGNLGQPNHLATLLLWGLIATFWATLRRQIGTLTAVVTALILLFGLALTNSRTAWIAVGLIILSTWWWRALWIERKTPWVVSALGLYFAACVAAVSLLAPNALNRIPGLSNASPDLRLSAWSLLIDAILQSPLTGYGWNQTATAHLNASLQHSALHVTFPYAHNIVLDLLVWCGIPVGIILIFGLLKWLWNWFRSIQDPLGAVTFLFLLAFVNHSMLEYPFSYAYFLLPAGLLIGTAHHQSRGEASGLSVGRFSFFAVSILSIGMLAITVTDYLRVEKSYTILRMEWAGFFLEENPQPPQTRALNQLQNAVTAARVVPRAQMSDVELQDLRTAVLQMHKPIYFRKFAQALTLNGRPADGRAWLERMCSVETERNCKKAMDEINQASPADR